jgi:hypothetical protein
MSVTRVHKTSNYTVMSNYHLRDKNLSLKAKGLMSVVLALPEDWGYSISGLVAICKEQETAVKAGLEELKEYGYLRVTKYNPDKTESGRFEYVYDFFEHPQAGEKQEVENLPIENQVQLNTNKSNTKELKTKIFKTKTKKEIIDLLDDFLKNI